MNFLKMVLIGVVSLCALGVSAQTEASKLNTILEEEWQYRLQELPLFATTVGHHEYDDKLPSMTQEDIARRAKYWQDLLHRLDQIDRAKLSSPDQINFDLLKFVLQDNVADFRFKSYLIPLNSDSGFHIDFARLPSNMPFFTVLDYENYIARMQAFPQYVQQHIALMREGLAIGMTLPKVVLAGVDVSIRSHIVATAEQSVFYAPFERMPANLPDSEAERLRASGRSAIVQDIVAGYQNFLNFMLQEYLPGARTSTGAAKLPDGRAYYAQRVRYFTTLDLSYAEVHETGLREVRRIRAEMEEIIKQVGFKGSFADFLTFLRTDPQFYPKTPDELLMRAAYFSKKMDGKLPALFKTLPRLPYGVAAVPDHLAPQYTGGRYVEPALGSTEPGYYWVNTYNLPSRTLYTLEALTLHEAVPGHHLQFALALEQAEVPPFRRFLYISTFGEGWGLYAERLGLEAGFYENPYSNFGRLTYEMWRACRLVVDTGLHAMGWSRQQALDYLAANTALSLHEVTTETDRYIAWPGQALSYKIGELKIRELRGVAETELAENFDVREFHEVILKNGSVTMPILEKQVRAYIAERASH